jgi:hemolysin III
MAPHQGQTMGEEIANSISHGVGAALSVAVLVVTVVAAALHGTAMQVVACAVYGASLVLLYTASTIYHGVTNGRVKRVFRIIDHCSIYLLIAGTYTPFALVTLRGVWGWWLFGAVWTLTALGVTYQIFFVGRMVMLSTAVYVGMGWLAVLVAVPLVRALPWAGLAWLLAGGLFYTGGVAFFASKRKWAHAVWHLFVLAGSACHFAAVYGYVVG